MSNPEMVIGITGGTGSGKTRLVDHLRNRLSKQLTILTQDNYYRARDTQPRDEKGVKNFDTLQSIDPDKLESDIKSLLSGKGFKQQVYHFNNPKAQPQWIDVNPAPVIIVEGLFALSYEPIFNLTDISIFIEASEEVMLQRRIARDFEERGYDRDDVEYRFNNHFLPAFRQHVLPVRDKATFIISNNGHFEQTVEELESSILSKIDFLS